MKKFGIKKEEDKIYLYNIKGILHLKEGDIFFKTNTNKNHSDILYHFNPTSESEELDKNYLIKVISLLEEEKEYDFTKLEKRTLLEEIRNEKLNKLGII